MANSPRFWNWIARRYARMPVRDEAAYREKLRRTQALLQPDWQVLEIGCGTGTTALEHAPHVASVRAVDVARNMIEICREKAAASGLGNVRFEEAEIGNLEVVPGSLDAVLAMSILHLLDNCDAVIGQVFEMLRPGGVFVSSTTCLGGQGGLVIKGVLPLGAALGLLPRLHAFTVDELTGAMEAAGFEIEQCWQPDGPPATAVFIAARKPGQARGVRPGSTEQAATT